MEQVVGYLQSHGCSDCGETDWRVLEFDHRDPETKSSSVADLVTNNANMKRIWEEIEKCDVRCANCHRRKTAIDNNWYSYFGDGVARAQ